MTHKTRPPHEDPAFLRPKVTEFYEHNGDVVMRMESGATVTFKPGQRIQLGSCRPIVYVVDLDRIEFENAALRAQMLNEARRCWRVFFENLGMFPPNWRIADSAREFERLAAEIAP